MPGTRSSPIATSKPARMAAVALVFALSAAACATVSGAGQGDEFSLSTTVVRGPPETGFDSGLVSVGRLPAIYGAKQGEASNPRSFPFTWTNLPQGTKTLAVVLDDPDAKPVLTAFGMRGDFFLHWLAVDIDPALGGLPDNAAATMHIAQGLNGTGNVGYIGPQPPADVPADTDKVRIHVYRLKVYALSAPAGLRPGFDLDTLMDAINDKTLGMAQLNVSYSNQ